MRIIKIIAASYIGSNIGLLFGEFVIIEIAGEEIDLLAILTTGTTEIPPVLLGLVLSGIIGAIMGVSFIKKGKMRALAGGSGAFLGLMVATSAVYNVSIFYRAFYLIYPLFSFVGWQFGKYIFKDNSQSEVPVESTSDNRDT